MAIRKSKINIDTEERSDFDNMMNDVENEVEEQQAEDGLVNRVPELKQLSEDIDKATSTFINATLELESAIQQYQRAEVQLGGAVTTIGKKVDTINQHINKVLENAPNQLKVSVNVNDADWQKIQELFAKERQWMTSQMQIHIREVNSMFADERKKVRERYKEYGGVFTLHLYCIKHSVIPNWGISYRHSSYALASEAFRSLQSLLTTFCIHLW